jgi:hypothetical protein
MLAKNCYLEAVAGLPPVIFRRKSRIVGALLSELRHRRAADLPVGTGKEKNAGTLIS